MKIKYWNDLENNVLINKVFSYKVKIGKIDLFNVEISRDGPTVWLYFDLIDELPDIPSPKWGKPNINYNRCRIGLGCFGVSRSNLSGLAVDMILNVSIVKDDIYKIHFVNENIKFNIECLGVTLIPPSVYLSD